MTNEPARPEGTQDVLPPAPPGRKRVLKRATVRTVDLPYKEPEASSQSAGIASSPLFASPQELAKSAPAGIASNAAQQPTNGSNVIANGTARFFSDGSRAKQRTPLQLARQEKCFLMNLAGKSQRAIAEELHLTTDTVRIDIRCEELLRAEESASRREFERERALSSYDAIAARALRAHEEYRAFVAKHGADAKMTDKSLDVMLKAQERKDRLQGLDAAIKVELGIQPLLTALDDDLPD